jgi:hypothetical protein
LNGSLINISVGSFYSNNQTVNTGNLWVSSGAAYFGTSVINSNNCQMMSAVHADSTTINSEIFWGGNNIYHNVNFSGSNKLDGNNTFDHVNVNGDIEISSSNIFDTLQFNTPGQIISLGSGSIQTINSSLIANGTCTGLTVIQASIPLQQAIINKPSGNASVNYVLMQDIQASGGATFTANNSVAVYDVSGWNISPTPIGNLYWVGGSGNWNDPGHWSTSSGGAGGNCVPTPFDNVFFDAGSFPGTNEIVSFNCPVGYCRDMNWTGAKNVPEFMQIANNNILKIYGSLTFIPGMANGVNNFSFESMTVGDSISTAGQNMGKIQVNGLGGSNTLKDNLNTENIFINRGIFYSNDQTINCANDFWSNSIYSKIIYLGKSVVNVNGNSCYLCDPVWFFNSNQLILDADSAEINMTGNVYPRFFGGGKKYHHLNFTAGSANARMDDSNTFDKVTLNGNLSVLSSNTFDTLYFNNPGQTVALGSSSTQVINRSFMANASAGFPIGLKSTTKGVRSFISMPAGDTVCVNYIYMQDQDATGGAEFYAGMYSADIANDTGWQFISCVQPISNVWPGDANYDLIANNMDILNIGLAFGGTGFVRPGASNNYVAQPCLDWPSQFQNGVNAKHADCDGNGTVNFSDTIAVSLNYGQTHLKPLAPVDSINATGPDLYFQVSGVIPPGSTISIPILLGTSSKPANNFYGIAFTVNFDTAMVQAGSVSVSYAGSWLVGPQNNVHLEKNLGNGSLDLGFSRIDHQNVSGSGVIAMLTFKIANNASGNFNLSFSNAKADESAGSDEPVHPVSSSHLVSVDEIAGADIFSIYPNPSSDYLYLTYNSQTKTPTFEIVDVTGRILFNGNLSLNQIDISSLHQGIYLLKITDGDTRLAKQFLKN